VLTGNLGTSIANNAPVASEVFRAVGNTIVISIIAVILSSVIALALGVIAAYRVGSPVDRLVTAISVFGISVPTFWLGVVLVIVFAVNLKWLPATGMGSGSG